MPTAAAAMLAVRALFRLPALAIILVVLLVDDPGQFGGTWKMNVYRRAALAVEPDGALWATIDDVIGGTAGKWVLAAGFTAVTAGLLVLAGLVHRGGHAARWAATGVLVLDAIVFLPGLWFGSTALVESADLHAVDLPDAAGAGVLAVALIAVPVVRIVGIVPVVAALVLNHSGGRVARVVLAVATVVLAAAAVAPTVDAVRYATFEPARYTRMPDVCATVDSAAVRAMTAGTKTMTTRTGDGCYWYRTSYNLTISVQVFRDSPLTDRYTRVDKGCTAYGDPDRTRRLEGLGDSASVWIGGGFTAVTDELRVRDGNACITMSADTDLPGNTERLTPEQIAERSAAFEAAGREVVPDLLDAMA
jgi:hypothetical protein